MIKVETYLPPHLGSPGQRRGAFVTEPCCSSAEIAAESRSELSDSQAQVLENEKTKSIECQSKALTEARLTLPGAVQLSHPRRGLRNKATGSNWYQIVVDCNLEKNITNIVLFSIKEATMHQTHTLRATRATLL